MLKIKIETKKNLLAFSAGVDSSALFFLLLNDNIPFDIAIVDYNLRKQSKDEVQYAKDLANKYNKRIYLRSYDKDKFSEKKARDFRYDFFDNIIKQYDYDSLITAHQLNDKLEWFLMQFSKGSGLKELIGLKEISKRKNYIVYKPLLDISKEELLVYLESNEIKYFIDETNINNKYKRNYFRNEFSNKFLKEYKYGIKKSFDYIDKDIQSLDNLYEEFKYKDLYIAKFKIYDENIMIRFIDKCLKKLGVIVSSSTRNEILRQKEIIISNKIAVSIINNFIWVSYCSDNIMDKKFKEKCRINKIPKNIRAYLYKNNLDKFLNSYSKFDFN